MEDLTDERAYLVSLNISVCTESTCDASYVILNNMLLPKQPCSWSEGFSIPGQYYNNVQIKTLLNFSHRLDLVILAWKFQRHV